MIELETILSAYTGKTRHALLPALWDVQTHFGFISAEHVHQISHLLRVPEADIYGVIGFYSLFHDQPTGERIIRVCTDPICGLHGADELVDKLHHNSEDLTVEHTTCLGMCDHAPAALVSVQGEGEHVIPSATVQNLMHNKPDDYHNHSSGNPAAIFHHTDRQFTPLKKASSMTSQQVIEIVEQSGLIGRGGAAFPTGLKWKLTRQSPEPIKYMVCNADESEPGTFKDRILLEDHPLLLLEGIAIGAYAIGASEAYIFVRGEYPRALETLRSALAEAEPHLRGLKIHLRRGAGAYICGEETALFEAIEGKRGFPRIKPPYPTVFGLFGKPTVVNNVETLCAIPLIIQHGADWFRQYGTKDSTGTKLVSVSGHVKQPGVYEISPGITLRQLLDDFCGGVKGELQAVLMGGAAGTFLTPDDLDIRLTFEDLRAAGSTFGSGAVMVFNQTTNLPDVLKRLGRFFQHESCGKCFPCQMGTQRQLEILERIESPLTGDRQRLVDIGLTMKEASICGLGQTAASAVLSAMQKFPHLFED